MFNKAVSGLTLASPAADRMFPDIYGYIYNGDRTFTATMRALLHKRIASDQEAMVSYTYSSWSEADCNGYSDIDAVRSFLDIDHIFHRNGILHIHNFRNINDENNAFCSAILERVVKCRAEFSGFEPMQDLSKFLEQKKINAKFFVNKERCCTLIAIERLDIKKWHLLQSFLPRYFPKYFADNPLTAEETKLLKTLTQRYAPAYEDAIEAFASHFDFRSQAIRDALHGFENRFEKKRLESVRRTIQQKRDYIEELEDRFAHTYTEIRDLTTQELGLIAKLNGEQPDDESELLEYFLCNKHLNIVDTYDGTIEFVVATTISNFDPDVFSSAIRRKGESFFYRHYETRRSYGNEEMTDDRIEMLMKAIFDTEELKLRVCAAYSLNFDDGRYAGLKNYNFDPSVLATHTPNQHIQYYACLGGNERTIRDAMKRRDYVAAVMACCASAENINFTEPNTGTFFMQKICAKDAGRIIQMPDGGTMTPLEAVKWLEQKKEQQEEGK